MKGNLVKYKFWPAFSFGDRNFYKQEQRLKFLREQQEKNRPSQVTQQQQQAIQEKQPPNQGTDNEIRIRCLRDTISNQDVKLQRFGL